MLSALVALQSTTLTKLHLAHIAFVRFLVRVNTHMHGQFRWISKHLLAHIALVLRSLPLHSFLKRRFFFLYLLIRLEIIILVRNPQTQHQRFFFLHFFFFSRHLQNRPRVHRALRMWILSSAHDVFFESLAERFFLAYSIV